MVVSPNLWLTINLYKLKNTVFQLSHGIKSIHRCKLYQWYTHSGKTFLQLLLLKVCKTFLCKQSNKVYDILWSVSVFVAFLEKKKPNRYRSSHSEVFLQKGVLKICSKCTGEHSCQSVISIKLHSLHIFRKPFVGTPLDGCFRKY